GEVPLLLEPAHGGLGAAPVCPGLVGLGGEPQGGQPRLHVTDVLAMRTGSHRGHRLYRPTRTPAAAPPGAYPPDAHEGPNGSRTCRDDRVSLRRDVLADLPPDGVLAAGADHPGLLLTALEQDQRGDAHDAVV